MESFISNQLLTFRPIFLQLTKQEADGSTFEPIFVIRLEMSSWFACHREEEHLVWFKSLALLISRVEKQILFYSSANAAAAVNQEITSIDDDSINLLTCLSMNNGCMSLDLDKT